MPIQFKIILEPLEDQDELDPANVQAFRVWLADVMAHADFFMRVYLED